MIPSEEFHQTIPDSSQSHISRWLKLIRQKAKQASHKRPPAPKLTSKPMPAHSHGLYLLMLQHNLGQIMSELKQELVCYFQGCGIRSRELEQPLKEESKIASRMSSQLHQSKTRLEPIPLSHDMPSPPVNWPVLQKRTPNNYYSPDIGNQAELYRTGSLFNEEEDTYNKGYSLY